MQQPSAAGRFIYVMGASGAGKDSVMSLARQQLGPADAVVFSHRYVTRPAELGHENYVALTPAEFTLRRDRGLFLFDWRAHDLAYGIGIEADLWRRAGLDVVISGSRAHFATLPALPHLLPVLIDAPPDVLRQRLLARGREGTAAIEARLARGQSLRPAHPKLVTVENAGLLAAAAGRFLALLRGAAIR
ncbi:ribose 1,5-bisphosphokinase [Dongia mobilis]|uniref:Ribose 1,5-bisphosphate phosphokinase PhnN n=1 Tax=Dongia mobilis TaxID=578943 RepID=A0A4R6WFQ0_9PROT|nr:phosphonate metabolism protein/1,5-bisphosphokinase (PRPP-forming) PhnN [Dongia mobilis]TDQ78899.1 ribose 1,5-bisphosphokinase [Dongia mobilis]